MAEPLRTEQDAFMKSDSANYLFGSVALGLNRSFVAQPRRWRSVHNSGEFDDSDESDLRRRSRVHFETGDGTGATGTQHTPGDDMEIEDEGEGEFSYPDHFFDDEVEAEQGERHRFHKTPPEVSSHRCAPPLH